MKNIQTKKIAGIGILTALLIALAFFSNYVSFGTININLALIPIVVGACLYGPWWGLFLGVVDGVVVILAPSTLGYFMPINAIATILTCTIKTGVAGLLSGFVFKLLKNKNDLVAVIIASIIVPIINTGIFIVCDYFFFNTGNVAFNTIIVSVLTINFLIEFLVNAILSPTIYKLVTIYLKQYIY